MPIIALFTELLYIVFSAFLWKKVELQMSFAKQDFLENQKEPQAKNT